MVPQSPGPFHVWFRSSLVPTVSGGFQFPVACWEMLLDSILMFRKETNALRVLCIPMF